MNSRKALFEAVCCVIELSDVREGKQVVPVHPSAGPLGGWWVIFVASRRAVLHAGPS